MGYTASDLLGVGAGFLLFALFAFAPGYTFGWLSNVFQFRRRRLATRIAAAVPISIGLTPITAYFLWRCWLPLVWIVFGASGVVCAILLARDARAMRLQLSRAGWAVLAIAAGWLFIGTFSLVDLQIGNRLYFPLSSYDHATRAAFTAALARDGIPPHNPFFFAGQPALLRYHYFWLIPCALVDRLGGSLVSARISLIAGVLWCGLGLFAVIALYLRFFQARGGDQIERRTLIAVSLLAVTGLDIVPTFLIDLAAHTISPSIEWWNEQIAAWITTALWVPHDLAALIAGLTGFLLVWDAAAQGRRRYRIAGTMGSGLAFASCVGSSIYIGATVAAGCALWLAIVFQKRWWRHALVLAGAGMLATILLLPFLLQVRQGVAGAGPSSKSAPLAFTVRSFTIANALVNPGSPGKLLELDAATLPLNYFLEFGFFFVVACLGVRRIWTLGFRDQADWGAVALGAASLFTCTFVRSTLIANNDLAWRSPLVVQFILLLWAAEMWNEGTLGFRRSRTDHTVSKRRTAPYLVVVMLVLGVMGSCFELCVQRTFPILSDSYGVQRLPWLSLDKLLGRRTFEVRRAYEEMDRTLPTGAVVQAAPTAEAGSISAELYSGRQMVADVGNCGTTFGGSEKFCENVILPRLMPLFDDRRPVTAEDVSETCRVFSITALLFEDTDPVWNDKSSWVWKSHALLSNGLVRVIDCGEAGTKLHGNAHQ